MIKGTAAQDRSRIRAICLVTIGLFVFLAVCLWRIQVLGGERYALLARNNCVRLVRKPAPRGRIYDRSGSVLVDNRPGYDVEVVPEDVEDRKAVAARLGEILGIGGDEVTARMRGYRPFSYLPVTIERDVGMDQVAAVEERRSLLPGVHVGVYPRRHYAHGALAAHLIGYLGKISPSELEKREEDGYTRLDLIGKSGVEREYEDFLAGRAGGEEIVVDHRGYLDRVRYRQDPEPGNDLVLNLDLETQRAADAVLEGGAGAVVALDPRSGAVLAMASGPSFDPNDLIPPVGRETVRALFDDPSRPMMNRAVSGLYPPGSVFKPIVALAALGCDAVNEKTTFTCSGVFVLGRHPFHCWNEKGHGNVSIVDAIMLSCNVFFYNAGMRAGRDRIVAEASEFGLMEKSGIDLPGEKAGVVPTAEWRAARGIGRWNKGDTVVMAIGQGYMLLTPLRAAMVMGAIANGGTLFRPRVAERVVSPLGDTVESFGPEAIRTIDFDRSDLSLVKEGLRRSVNSGFGTGQKAKPEGVEAAGKTGTVQVGPEGKRKNHSWFVGFAPFEKPEIVVAVLLEEKESGGYYAAPAAKKIFDAYFSHEPKQN